MLVDIDDKVVLQSKEGVNSEFVVIALADDEENSYAIMVNQQGEHVVTNMNGEPLIDSDKAQSIMDDFVAHAQAEIKAE